MITPGIIRTYDMLTEQQQAILETATAPGKRAKIFRVNAAAGTGKTTTLIALAQRLVKLGHSPCYIAFNRNTKQEALTRFGSLATKVTVKTIDGSDYPLLPANQQAIFRIIHATHTQFVYTVPMYPTTACALHATKDMDGEPLPIDLKYVQRKVEDMFGQNVEKLALELKNPKRRPSWRTRVLKNIEKTLETFLRSADAKVQRCYFHAKSKSDFKDIQTRINPEIWYPKQAAELWRFLRKRANQACHSHETIMKIAHLTAAKIQDCTSILCDESQDLNPCQIEWLKLQCSRYGTPLWFVGDSAQSIYGFRGAKPDHLLSVGGQVLHLTKSWRFGHKIAPVPNTVLFAKKHSPQQWEPYYVEGCGKEAGQVTSHDLSPKDGPFTVLARSNVELLTAGLKYLNKDPSVKIFVNGRLDKWMAVKKSFFPFWHVWEAAQHGLRYPLKLGQWKKHSSVSWQEVCDDTSEEGSNTTEYRMIVQLINVHKEEAYSAMETFVEKVVKKSTRMSDADIVLSTIHSAKGMEWDRVQVLDGALKHLANRFAFNGNKARFAFGRNDEPYYTPDDINLWYVAVTRAKRQLSVPPKFINIRIMFDIIRFLSVSNRATGVHLKTIEDAFKEGKFDPREIMKESYPTITPAAAVSGSGYDKRRVDLIDRDLVKAYDEKFCVFQNVYGYDFSVMLELDREDRSLNDDDPSSVDVPRTPDEVESTTLKPTPVKRTRDSTFDKEDGPKVVKKSKQSVILFGSK